MKMTMEQAFGQEIKETRESMQLSQEALAFEAEIHRTYVSMIERGLKSPTLAVIVRLARALNLKPSELLKRSELRFRRLCP
jgi:transcriptional regulator with XRE-family HTH domain